MEAEILLSGAFKNIAELEENINLPELRAMVEATRAKEHRHHKFMALLKGIDLDEPDTETPQQKFEKAQQRVRAQKEGRSIESVEFEDLGIDFETD